MCLSVFVGRQIADLLILSSGAAGILFSAFQYAQIAKITIRPQPTTEASGLRDIDAKTTERL